MKTSKHTSEPWEVDTSHGGVWITGDGQKQKNIAIVVESEFSGSGSSAYPSKIANAERIVACVNACKGLEDPSVVPALFEYLNSILLNRRLLNDEHFRGPSDKLFARVEELLWPAK